MSIPNLDLCVIETSDQRCSLVREMRKQIIVIVVEQLFVFNECTAFFAKRWRYSYIYMRRSF